MHTSNSKKLLIAAPTISSIRYSYPGAKGKRNFEEMTYIFSVHGNAKICRRTWDFDVVALPVAAADRKHPLAHTRKVGHTAYRLMHTL
jgi:hypothetical protein